MLDELKNSKNGEDKLGVGKAGALTCSVEGCTYKKPFGEHGDVKCDKLFVEQDYAVFNGITQPYLVKISK